MFPPKAVRSYLPARIGRTERINDMAYRSGVLRGVLGFCIGLAIAAYLTHNIGPSPEVWAAYLP